MDRASFNILIVEPVTDRAESLRDHLDGTLACNTDHVPSGEDALLCDRLGRYDLCLVAAESDENACAPWLGRFRAANACPLILLNGNRLTREQLIDVMRLGAVDVIDWPGDDRHLTASVRRIAHDVMRRRRLQRRQKRLRRTVSRIIHERHDLHERMDLICRDIVQAYRRLAEKVTRDNALPRGVTE